MRVSVDRNDPGYSSTADTYTVLLDGQRVAGAVTADDEKGVVVRYKKSENGQFEIDPVAHTPVIETLHGRVELIKGPPTTGS